MDENEKIGSYPDSIYPASDEDHPTRTSRLLQPIIVLTTVVLLTVCTGTGIVSAGLVFAGEASVVGGVGVAQAFSFAAVSQAHSFIFSSTLSSAGTVVCGCCNEDWLIDSRIVDIIVYLPGSPRVWSSV